MRCPVCGNEKMEFDEFVQQYYCIDCCLSTHNNECWFSPNQDGSINTASY